MLRRETITNETDHRMLVLVEQKAMKGEAQDYWLRPAETLELRAEDPTGEDNFHFKEIPEGVIVGYVGDLGLITAWQAERKLDCGYQRPDGWPESLFAEIRRLEEEAYADTRLYRVNFDPARSWFTGRLPDGRQALGLPGEEEVFLQLFDAAGRPLDQQRLSLPGWRCEFDGSWVNEEELWERLRREVGFAPGPIDVRQFSFWAKESQHYPLSVEPLPETSSDQLRTWREWGYGQHWLDSLDSVLDLREWLTEGRYVLHFGNNYWVNREGEVTDS
jgi:hypothetical protein